MLESAGNTRWQWLHLQLGEVIGHLTRIQYVHFHPEHRWRPAINAYRYTDRIEICVDLAGVEKSAIDLKVEPNRLVLYGARDLPECSPAKRAQLSEYPLEQIICLEIECGAFRREVALWPSVDPEKATAEHQEGLLWVYLPLLGQA